MCLLQGWSDPERGFTWSTGAESCFLLPVDAALPGDGTLVLELDLTPFDPPRSHPGQRLSVRAGGALLAEERIIHVGKVAYVLPRSAWPAARELVVTLHTPDFGRPSAFGLGTDERALAFMLRSAALWHRGTAPPVPGRLLPPLALPPTRASDVLDGAFRHSMGLAPSELLEGFESLGHNCEFGMAQRHFGIDPLGLLRFAGITLADLLDGLDSGFAGLGEAAQLEILLEGEPRREFMVRDTRHNLLLHTMRYPDETEAAPVHAEALRSLRFLNRMFAERLENGGKLFVFQRGGQLLPSQARPLLDRLQFKGPNALLFITEGHDHPPGTVEELDYGFFRGWTDRVAPAGDVGNCNLFVWLSVCANARRLWSVQTAGAAGPHRS